MHINELLKMPISDGWFSAIKPGFDSPYRYNSYKRLQKNNLRAMPYSS